MTVNSMCVLLSHVYTTQLVSQTVVFTELSDVGLRVKIWTGDVDQM